MMSTSEIIAVVQARKDGKKIQWRPLAACLWRDCPLPVWNFADCEYRVKPEPHKPLEIWINQYEGWELSQSLGNFHLSKEDADRVAKQIGNARRKSCHKFVEILEVTEE